MEMYKLNCEQVTRMREDVTNYIASQEDVRSVLKDMYCGFFSDKTDDIGYVMADKVMALVSEYNQDICDAKADSEAWLERKVQELLSGKDTLVERCNALYQSRVAMTVSSIYAVEGQKAAEAYQLEYGNKAFGDTEVSEELEQKLKAELKEVIRNNKVLLGAMDAFVQNTETAENSENVTVALNDDASKLKAIMTMQAYLQSGEDGYLQNVFPESISLHDITYSVCASVDTLSVAKAIENEEIPQEEGVDILCKIGIVLGGAVCVGASAMIGTAVAGLLGMGFLGLIGGLVVTWACTSLLVEPAMTVGIVVVEGVKVVVRVGVRLAVFAGRKLLNGVKRLVNGLRSFFSREVEEDSEKEQNYTFPEHEATECNNDHVAVRQPAHA